MNPRLQFINFVGVVVVACVSAGQWRTNRSSNLEVISLEKTRLEHLDKIAEQEKSLKGYAADLDAFRDQLGGAKAALKDTETKLRGADREISQLTGERDQLRTSVTNWASAVTLRDERLKEASDQLQKLGIDRNEAITKFNELAEKYNRVVNDLNTRTKDFNDLVEKFNALAKSSKNASN